METKLHHGSGRQKSRVPRTRLPQRYEYDASVSDYRNGAVKKDHSTREYESHGMSSASLHLLADTDENKEWQRLIGERVCISGVKPGILRYFGRTNFAQGYWCGIELDEPVGKNNGTVNGVVYFDCKPNHGIFAPVSKVSKLNDLNACTWRVDSLPPRSLESQHAHSNWDYNVGFLPNTQEVKFIKNSMSDPTSLKPKVRAGIPHSSQSFTYDARSVTEKRRSESLGAKALRNYEVPDLSSRHTKSFSGNSFNILNKASFSKSVSDKNKFIGSNVGRMTDNRSDFERLHASNLSPEEPSTSTAKSNVQIPSLSMAMDEYEQFLQTPTNSGQISPLPTEAKRFKDMPFFDYTKMPDAFLSSFQSLEYPDIEDELDNDDQMSVDYDESLGILTPSQMKDFTLCPDFPTSSSDMKVVDFPNSESFDDINELPEDEQVHDVSVQYVSETSANRNIEITKQNSGKYSNNNFILTNDDCKRERMFSSTNKFLSSISQKDYERIQVESCSTKSSVNCNSLVYGRTHKLNNIESSTNYSIPSVDLEKEFRDKSIVSSSLPKSKTIDLVNKSEVELVQESFNHASNDFRQYLRSSEQSKTIQIQHVTECYDLPNETKAKPKLPVNANEELCIKNYDTDSSRDSLTHGESENINLKEKLTVSWEDCIPHNNNTFTSVERPESVYTVGSSDTGFQEDGEIELETGMATSMDSTESTKRFSTASRDSCIVPDEVDCYKIAESNSTSGYSTGLSDSCCNDRPEDDLSSKPLTEEELQDSVGPCDSEDGFSFQENNSLSKDSEVVEMSDVTAETATVLCNDSTSEALCETMVEDTTLTEINDLLSPEEAKSSNLSEKTENSDAPMEQSKVTADGEDPSKTSEKAPSSISTGSPAQSTPEKKSNRNRPTLDTQKKQPLTSNRTSRTNRVCDDSMDKKQIVKSPKKNVMSKIKAMIEATSCKTNNKNKPEVSEPVNKRNVSAPKRSRWEAVTSKIAASLAEEKTKPKTKREIKSRVDTNLTSARQQITCKSPKLGSSRNSNCGDGTMTPLSGTSRERKPLAERNSTMNLGKEVRAAMTRDAKRNVKSPRHLQRLLSLMAGCAPVCRMTYVIQTPPGPGKPCITSRSASPVAASESSTTSVSVNSHNSRSKIAHWKGSTSTIASSIPPVTAAPAAVKRQTPSAPPKASSQTARMVNSRTVNKKPVTVPKIRVTSATSSVRMRSPSPATSSKPERSAKHSRTSKGQCISPDAAMHSK